jgi:hypothetical protein
VPGEVRVRFAADPEARRLVAAVAKLSATPFVLVGGLAVAARLRVFHRATQDLDAVVGEERRRFEQLAVETVTGAAVSDGTLTVDGVNVDIIDIDPTVAFEDIADLDEPHDRLFVAGHLFAYRDAAAVTLIAGDRAAVVTVATTRALLVTKLGAYHSPRRDPRKHSSDGLDVYELGRILVTEAGVYADVPATVPDVLRWALEKVGDHPGELVRRLAVAGRQVSGVEVEALVSLLLETTLG